MHEDLRDEFLDELEDSFEANSFIKLTLGKFRGVDMEAAQNIYVRVVSISGEPMLALTYRYSKKDIVKNSSIEDALDILKAVIGSEYLSGEMFTVNSNIQLIYSKKRVPRLNRSRPTMKKEFVDGQHNRSKKYSLDKSRAFLNVLGVSNNEGEIKKNKYSKFRQINKFVEILNSEIRSSDLDLSKKTNIWDMGSGKSYLTFAVYDFLGNIKEFDISVTGIEFRKDMVDLSNENSKQLGFDGLKFVEGSIQSVDIGKADIVIALHACDTATDDAIAKAIKADSEIIVVAPCCHKYVRNSFGKDSVLKSVMKHGILEERIAESITDGLRALILEGYGYKTKVFEFASKEHTGKNVMITAVKGRVSEKKKREAMVQIEVIKKEFGFDDFYLDLCLAK